MTEHRHNPDDIELLISRSLDEALSPADRGRLERALAASPELRAHAERYRSLHRLLARWTAESAMGAARSIEPSVAEALRLPHAHSVEAVSPAADDDDLGGVDDLLGRYGREDIRVNWDAFTERVIKQIEPAHVARPGAAGPARPQRMWLRLAMPLAAAAALALAVLYGPWWNGGSQPGTVVQNSEPRPFVDPATTGDAGLSMSHKAVVVADVSYSRVETVSRVTFHREPAPEWSPSVPRREVGYASVAFGSPATAGDSGPF